MKAHFVLERPTKASVVFDNGLEITLLITDEHQEGTHIRVTGDRPLMVKPGASNEVRIQFCDPD